MYRFKEWIKSVFVYPPLGLEKVDYDAYWRSKREGNMGALSDWQMDRADFVVETLKGKEVSSLSDIACGEGSILKYAGDKLSVSKLLGTDISDVALDRARGFGIEAVKLDIGRVEELKNIPEADYELLFEILEHVPHSEELLKAAYEKSKHGIFFSFPNTGFFTYRLRLLFGRFPLQWRLFPGEHVRFWTLKDLRWWLKSLGYKDYRIHCYKGVPVLNKLWPSLFAQGFVIFIPR